MPRPAGPGRAGDLPPWRSTITGRVDVTSLLRDGQRTTIRVYVPPGYELSDQPMPVLYMFDGQNLFDRATSAFGMEWEVDETIEGLVAQGRFGGALVVGMDSPAAALDRYAQYTAWDWMMGGVPIEAQGQRTAEFLVDDVMAHVRSHYRVAQDRARVGLAGSSLGGYMTLYTAVRHPELFGRLLAFSPVLLDEPMCGHELRDVIVHQGFAADTWVYLDMGDAEELDYLDSPERLVADLAETTRAVANAARPPHTLVSRVVPGARHDERAWAERFGPALLWAFAGGAAPQ